MNQRKLFSSVLAAGLLVVLVVQLLASHAPALAGSGTDIAGPLGSVSFGEQVYALPGGNIVVVDTGFYSNTGAVYVYDGATRALISRLTGSNPGDQLGFGYVTILPGGNFVVSSPNWNGSRGAVTWGSGSTGVSGTVSATNSLVGSSGSDTIGIGGVAVLSNGNYVVASRTWNGNRGAVTWGSGTSGVTGVVSAANSLVGSGADDQVSSAGVVTLSNGNYVVASPAWAGNLGAATWGNGATGSTGAVSSNNSLIGSSPDDQAGWGVTALSGGNYIVQTPYWNGSSGAATWGSGTTGITGTVATSNSLVGGSGGDQVGGAVDVLSNGNYVVRSLAWNAGNGAVTWGSGTTGITGTVSPSISLVGSSPGDSVGGSGTTILSNGNYVVRSPSWNGNRGAATWGSGSSGITGVVSSINSLVGSNTNDNIASGSGIALSNGNYVVASPYWNGNSGAVSWGSGAGGTTGVVSSANSLVGSSPNDFVGTGNTALSNGSYVVQSPNWNGNKGAATWGSGTTGITGIVSSTNSLIGGSANDSIASDGVTRLSNGNYVVQSTGWNGGMGAATWGSGSSGITGVVSSTNSLVGSNINDIIALGGVIALSNGNYVVASPAWNENRGAATWGSGAGGTTGVVSSTNSLAGSQSNDRLSGNGAFELSNGNYAVQSPLWAHGLLTYAGAVTFGLADGSTRGAVTARNSVLGGVAGGGTSMKSAFDSAYHTLVVGRPKENIVTIFDGRRMLYLPLVKR